MRRALLLALALTGLAPSAVLAKSDAFTTKAVADAPAIVLDPAKAYILVESEQASLPAFARQPSAADLEQDNKNRAEELAKKRADWEKTAGRRNRPPEPTEETLEWPEFGQSHMVLIGPDNRFFKKGVSLYLEEVPPGDYAFYGNAGPDVNGGIVGACACMGTVVFNAAAGKVTALKLSIPVAEAMARREKGQPAITASDLPAGVTSFRLVAATELARDPRIPADSLVAPVYRPLARMTNWYGIEIDRLMPIEGVFRYERDKLIDLTQAAAPAAAAP